jgi:hypothetical protein
VGIFLSFACRPYYESTSTSVFDDKEKDPDYNQPSEGDLDTDGVAPPGGNRYSDPRHNARRQQHQIYNCNLDISPTQAIIKRICQNWLVH